ncbi:exodeoxyribonuclease V subunit gamma [Pseudidiomarina insulisalsae]|uniref:RecBCD enzyme subunit RecC n=1 Tax=Pseudidiomarina insulisalsae TaxID=575789 RepID=A0A432YQE0_9GAMM|nr:exodeoxyribonuclease V subunit gamma [Pseudidiomarina insulisalsae]RUO63568.1 exodeoxyribonuclease V subunit gamma [Pseudidiomarina insulisalsae]
MSEQRAGLIVAHSHKLEELTQLVVEITRIAPLDPLDAECVLVQSNGIAQWLKRHWAEALGIATMVDVTLPARFQWQAYRAVLGHDLPRHSPFDKDRLTWRLLRLLPPMLSRPEFAALANYMRDDSDQRKLYQLCERLADLYDQYQMYRADWLADWAAGTATAADADSIWQVLLWQEICRDVGDQGLSDRAQLHRRFIARAQTLRHAERPAGLPARIIVFGISSLPQQMIEVLNALAHCSQVILCVHNPCQHFWVDSISGRDELREIKRKRQRRKPGQAELELANLHTETHPLLASWGKQGGDYIRMLDAYDATQEHVGRYGDLHFDLFDETGTPDTALNQLQSDILHLRSISEARPFWQQHQDDSLKFVSCHSPQREVEVLHDQLLELFSRHQDLQPSDIIVMVPDIDHYAPHIQAVFGRYPATDPRRIPFTIADQGVRHRHPILLALEYALKLSVERATASELLDIVQVRAVQERFALSADDVEQLQLWLQEAGVRWALHGEHREQLGLPAAQGRNSWWFGLRRMLLGYAVGQVEQAESDWLGDEPYPEVGGLAANAAGGLHQLVKVLDGVFQHSRQSYTPAQWNDYLTALVEELFAADDDDDAWVVSRLKSQLANWVDAVEAANYDQKVPLTVVLESWLSKVDEHQLNQRFLAGSVNFATLMPMRAIPFKGVFLLGMNDGDYPRQRKPFDFDLMAFDRRPGDRSRREDDRYLFLEALLSARQWFYLSWCGRSIKDNTEKPPSVLVSQLRDHLLQLGYKAEVQEHFLQPFNPAYFTDQAAGDDYFSYAHEWHALHLGAPTAAVPSESLPTWLPDGPVSLRQLQNFFIEPARWLMNQRFQCYLPDTRVDNHDEETFALDGLVRWQLLERLSASLLQCVDAGDDALQWQEQMMALLGQMQRQGQLSAGAAGLDQQQQLLLDGQALWEHMQPHVLAYPQVQPPLALQFGADSGLRVQDAVNGVRSNAVGEHVRIQLSASRLIDKRGKARYEKLAGSWLEHLLLNTQMSCRTVLISAEGQLSLPALAREQASADLERLLSWAETGLREPLPWHYELVLAGWRESLKNGPREFIASEAYAFMNDAARQSYDEGNSRAGHPPLRRKARYLARFYPDYGSLPDTPRSVQFVTEVYRPLLLALAQEEQE